jgi:hypothetical protein
MQDCNEHGRKQGKLTRQYHPADFILNRYYRRNVTFTVFMMRVSLLYTKLVEFHTDSGNFLDLFKFLSGFLFAFQQQAVEYNSGAWD